MQILTAANKAYFGALLNLVGSAHFWAENYTLTVYDLGLGERLCKEVQKWRNVTLVPLFLQSGIPQHCSQIREYAWKPFVIEHALRTHQQVLWIDAGSDFRSPLSTIERLLQQNGYFLVQGQDQDMTQMSHSNTYEYLGHDKIDFKDKQHYSANLQAYAKDGPVFGKIVQAMQQAAGSQKCIAPTGSNISNHRFDQTVLSILAYTCGIELQTHTHLLAARRTQLQAKPEMESDRLVYTGRGSSKEYAFFIRDRNDNLLYEKYRNQSA